MRNRVPILRNEGLLTDHPPTIMRAGDGTIIEVSEWKSHGTIDAVHKNPIVFAMLNKFFEACDCIPLSELFEPAEMFAGFEAVAD